MKTVVRNRLLSSCNVRESNACFDVSDLREFWRYLMLSNVSASVRTQEMSRAANHAALHAWKVANLDRFDRAGLVAFVGAIDAAMADAIKSHIGICGESVLELALTDAERVIREWLKV